MADEAGLMLKLVAPATLLAVETAAQTVVAVDPVSSFSSTSIKTPSAFSRQSAIQQLLELNINL